MKNLKEKIIPLVILIAIPVFAFSIYLGNQARENKLAIDAEKQASADQLSAMESKIIELENKPIPKPQIIEKTITIDNTKYTDEPNLSAIINEWIPRVAFVACGWASDGIYTGSGTLSKLDGKIYVMTNKHVIDSNGYIPNGCVIGTTMGDFKIDWTQGVSNYENPYYWGLNEDFGYIRIDNYNQDLINLTNTSINICSGANIGDKLVVLGYPGVGSQESITATEGIISGIESNYYVTSAKIEHGNSGGAAILLKDDCYLGIPSYVKIGSAESMGRILKANFVISYI